MQWLKYCGVGERHPKAYLTFLLALSFLSNFLVGCLYTFGNIQPYLVSYIRERSQPSTLRYTQSTYLYSTQYAGFGVGIALCGVLELKFGARLSYIAGGVLTVVGLLLSYFTIQFSFWLLFVTYGVIYPLGVGVIYFVTIICATQWFPKRAGLAVGFVLGGVGLGGLAFGAIQTGFINTDNEFPNKAPYERNPDEKYFTQTELIKRVPFIFLIMGLIFGVVTAVTSLVIANPVPVTDKQEVALSKVRLVRIFGVLFSIQCYIQLIISAINVLGFGVIASLYKTYGLEVLKSSDYFLTALGGVANGVFSIVGRVLFGFLADKVGFKLAYAVQNGIMAVLLSTLYTTSLGYPVMYFIWVCGLFMSYGGYCSLVAIAILKSFGCSQFNTNYGIVATTGQFIASFLSGIVSDFCVSHLDWSGTFLLLGFIATIQTFLTLLLSERQPTEKHYTRNFLTLITIFND